MTFGKQLKLKFRSGIMSNKSRRWQSFLWAAREFGVLNFSSWMRWSARKNRFSIKTAQCERQFCREIKRAKAFLNCHASRADIYVNTYRDRSVRVLHSLFSIHCLAWSIQQYMNALFTSRGLADPNVESVNATCVLISTRLSARPKAHGPLKTFCSVCYALSLHDGTFESLPPFPRSLCET